MKNKRITLILLVFVLFSFASCKKDEPKTLSISPVSKEVSKNEEVFSISISSNTAWTVVSNKSWCTPTITSGTNDGSVVVSVDENTTENQRIAVITVSGTEVDSVTCTLIQTAEASSNDAYIAVTSPISSSVWQTGQTYTITWVDNITENVIIELYDASSLAETIISSISSEGSFSWSVPGSLNPVSNYKIKIASVSDDSLFAYSEPFSITTLIADIDGNTYPTVMIGTQVWMAEDLRVTHYPNGDAILNITADNTWGNLADNNTDDAYCFYNNDNTTDYGALYTYAAAIADNWTRDNNDFQGICPDGWHLPTDAEWTTLTDYLGGEDVAGGKMKETGITHWENPNAEADNSSGFTALPGGYRYLDIYESFFNLGYAGYWWSATEFSSDDAYFCILSCTDAEIYRHNTNKSSGFSVRCVKD